MKTFEQFLQEQHATGYYGADDDMPDNYEYWLTNLDPQEIIDFAEAHGKEMFKAGMQATYEEVV